MDQCAQIHDFEYSGESRVLERPEDDVYVQKDAHGGRRGRTKAFPRPGSHDKFTTRIWIGINGSACSNS